MYIQFLYIQNMFSIWLSKELVPTLSIKMTILFIHIVQYSTTPKEALTSSKLEISSRIHPTMIKMTVCVNNLLQAIWELYTQSQMRVTGKGLTGNQTNNLFCLYCISDYLANYYILVKNLLPKGTHSDL